MTELLEWFTTTDLAHTGWLHEERDTRGRWTHGATVPSEPGQERHGYQGKFMGYDPLVPSMAPADGRKPLSQPGRVQGDGTAADPIDVAGDMGKAVALMAAGRHVRLNSPAEIKPLLDEVGRQADAQGYSRAREPGWDLGNISVRGTRLFNEQTRGIPRTAMPQLNGPALPGTEAALLAGGANKFIELDSEFRAQLRRDGIDVRNERVPAGNLRATQTQLTAATVAGITKAAESGNPKVRHMLREPIWVTRDNYVIDGHHRWAADEALAFSGNGPDQIEVQRINLPVHLAIPYANQFAQQMGIEARPLGNSALVESATPMELGWKFDPFEKRDVRGRWTKSGEGYAKPDPERLRSSRATYKMPGDHPFFKANPVSAAHIVAAYEDSDAQERAQGMRWYADAHNLAKKMDHGDIEKNAGVIAALSPQTGWAVNMLNADRSLDLGRALGPGEGMITQSMQRNAQEAIDGEAADIANSSSKTKAFARLIRYGGDEPDDRAGQVVIDRHAMTVAMGKRIPKKEADKAPIGHDRYYQYVADQYRNAALEISKRGTPVSPHQLQAITWLRQQRINEAEDEAHIGMAENTAASRGGRRLSKGRNTMLRNSWQRWQAEAARHKYELIPGTTGPMSEQYANLLSAQILDFAFSVSEPRDARGRWAKFGAIGEAADIMRSNREGFSVSLHSGDEPKQGYMVAQTDHTHVFPESILDDRKALTTAIDEMLMSERSAFEDKDTYLGGWVHGGKLWLEPSDNITDKARAVREAAERNQIAIWDVNHGAEIQTGGTGGGRIIEHANTQGDRADPGWLLGPPGGRAAGGSGEAGRGDPVGIAAQVLEFRFDPLELRDKRGRWVKSQREQLNLHKLMRAAADPFVGAADPNEPALKAAVTRVATPASEIMPKALGESHEEWNGQVKLFHYDDNKQILAELDWNGDLRIATNVAQALQDGMSVPGPVHYPDAFEVVAHEMIHGVVPAGSAKANKEAYQKWSISRIEEGFTELGATYHAAEFFDQLGIGDREAGPWPGHTVHEMAVTAARPGEIEQGNAWRHYEGPTKDAQDWVQQVAREEGIQDLGNKAGVARVVELSDEVNRQGAAGKVGIMAQQLARAMTKDPKLSGDSTFIDDLTVKIAASILHEWNTDNPDGAAKQAYSAARAVALQTVADKQREMAERAAA